MGRTSKTLRMSTGSPGSKKKQEKPINKAKSNWIRKKNKIVQQTPIIKPTDIMVRIPYEKDQETSYVIKEVRIPADDYFGMIETINEQQQQLEDLEDLLEEKNDFIKHDTTTTN